MRIIRIVSDGTTSGTRLIDVESGESIGFVESIEWAATIGQPLTKTVVVFNKVPVELVAHLKYCGDGIL